MPVPPLPLLLPEEPLVDPDEPPEVEPLVELPLLVDEPLVEPLLVEPPLVDEVLPVEPPLLVEDPLPLPPLVELPLVDPLDEPPDEEPPEDTPHEGAESPLPQPAARGTPHASTHATSFFVPALILLLPDKLPSARVANAFSPRTVAPAPGARESCCLMRVNEGHSDHRCRRIGIDGRSDHKVHVRPCEFPGLGVERSVEIGNMHRAKACASSRARVAETLAAAPSAATAPGPASGEELATNPRGATTRNTEVYHHS
jgi:hypothetical protein